MTEPKPSATAATFPQDDGHGGHGLSPGGRGHSRGPCRGRQHDPRGPGRLRRPRHRRAGNALSTKPKGRSSSSPWPTFSRTGSTSSYETLKKATADKVDVPEDRKFIGFDGYQEGDGLPEAGRRGDPRHSAGLSLGALHLRDPEGPATSSWRSRSRVDGPTTRKMLALGEEAEEEEPQGRRRPDVPPLRGPRGAVRAASRTARSATCSCCGPIARPARRLSTYAAQARRHQRADVPDQEVPRVPLGQRRLLQRLPDPQHRRVLLDEGRLAGLRPRAPAAGTIGATASTRTSTPIRSSTRSPTARKMFLEGRNIDGCQQEFASYAHGSKGSAVISSNSHSPARCRIYKGQKFTRNDIVWAFPQPEPNPYQVEWDDLIHAIRKDKLYNEVKRGAEASLVTVDGPHGRPHRPDRHVRRDAQLQVRVRPGRRQADDDKSSTAAVGQALEALSHPAAWHRQGSRVSGLKPF